VKSHKLVWDLFEKTRKHTNRNVTFFTLPNHIPSPMSHVSSACCLRSGPTEARIISRPGLLLLLPDAAQPKRTSIEISNFLMRARKDPPQAGDAFKPPELARSPSTVLYEVTGPPKHPCKRESSAFHFDSKELTELRKHYYSA
jgi:hypothetical protein